MSLTIQQIITDAKRLAGRLKDRDTIADTLLNETNAITKKIDAMKQFQEEVDVLNEVANQKPHSQLIANIQKENRHLREIQQENRELRAALEDYQTTLEHIMTKYREHTTEEIYKTRIDFKALQDKQYDEIIKHQAEKIHEMAAVMEQAALIDEDRMVCNEEIIARLKLENQGLREMLGIAFKHGNLINKMEDKTIQTETST
ncbi:FGFR1 oncogene partner 2 homolog [Tribolium castaneum]|uniref:Circulating cathodic antigen homolog-like Protein n=1 Tax=Tribolium castaneum TaxID=7070 RepID=D1ZZP1_TRICA|nr:PREDICTED: FGFR1 oncogene partner 2 homolog [Tribolium castaneum]EFA01821.1 Circulating cathodic antigen homolog-like Protein [Tribolium castaneum]|eukprot:XP_974301.1 PREDICTED: FGFR1 oncogene partner 2 homolog [Tribolium castaneum]